MKSELLCQSTLLIVNMINSQNTHFKCLINTHRTINMMYKTFLDDRVYKYHKFYLHYIYNLFLSTGRRTKHPTYTHPLFAVESFLVVAVVDVQISGFWISFQKEKFSQFATKSSSHHKRYIQRIRTKQRKPNLVSTIISSFLITSSSPEKKRKAMKIRL